MLQSERAGIQSPASTLNSSTCGKWIAFFLLAAQTAFAVPSHGRTQPLPGIAPASNLPMAAGQLAEATTEKATSASAAGLALIQAAIGGVHLPSLQTLAGALGLNPAQIGQQAFEDSDSGMEAVSGIGDAVDCAVVVKWRPSSPGQNLQATDEPGVYLLSWDGKGWQASYLAVSSDALTLQVLPGTGNSASLFAVIIYRGMTAVPYPVIFRYQNHQASLVWDARSDSSSYTGYDFGSVRFEKAGDENVPVMIAAGQADPGLLIFPASQEETGRGFQVATAYVWKKDGYVPLRTEYTENRDYILYSFIAALHLHDFKKAYSLIDPGQFLNTKEPTLKLFQERIQNVWPEFIDDRIFEVPRRKAMEPESDVFILRLGGGKMNVYQPSFTAGPDFRLTGLARTESNE